MKKSINNISSIIKYPDYIELEWQKFYGISKKIELGNNIDITYKEQEVVIIPAIPEELDDEGNIVQEAVPAITETRNVVTDILVSESEVQKEQKKVKSEREKIIKASLEELLQAEDLSGAQLTPAEKGKLLSEKFFWNNIYKELQLHRIALKLLMKRVLEQTPLTAEEQAFIADMNEKDAIAEKILSKM